MQSDVLLISEGGLLGSLFAALTRYGDSRSIQIKNVSVFNFKQGNYVDIVSRPSFIILDISNEAEKEAVSSRLIDMSFGDIPRIHIQSDIIGLSEMKLIELLHESKIEARAKIQAAVDKKEMILIPSGNYKRRRGISPDYSSLETDQQETTHIGAFYIDKYTVTNSEYDFFLKSTTGNLPPEHWYNGKFPQNEGDHPVRGVNWDDVIAYAKWAQKRVPTPDEWEKAAFGEAGTNYPWGNEFDPKKCNVAASNIGGTTPVNRYDLTDDTNNREKLSRGSETGCGNSYYGVSDLIGNVWEWVYDWTSSSDNRMLMGGAWDTEKKLLENPVFARVNAKAKLRGGNFGFRLAISLDSYLMG